jgi:hypothetical protein
LVSQISYLGVENKSSITEFVAGVDATRGNGPRIARAKPALEPDTSGWRRCSRVFTTL